MVVIMMIAPLVVLVTTVAIALVPAHWKIPLMRYQWFGLSWVGFDVLALSIVSSLFEMEQIAQWYVISSQVFFARLDLSFSFSLSGLLTTSLGMSVALSTQLPRNHALPCPPLLAV
jgi:hypothetical protein